MIMRKQAGSYHFTYYDRLIVSGLILFEDIEIEGRAAFTFTPGRPATGPSYASGGDPAEDPELEIDDLAVFGHDPAKASQPGYAGEYRTLAPSDPLWQRIHDWLMAECFSEMAEEAVEAELASAERRAEERREMAAAYEYDANSAAE